MNNHTIVGFKEGQSYRVHVGTVVGKSPSRLQAESDASALLKKGTYKHCIIVNSSTIVRLVGSEPSISIEEKDKVAELKKSIKALGSDVPAKATKSKQLEGVLFNARVAFCNKEGS